LKKPLKPWLDVSGWKPLVDLAEDGITATISFKDPKSGSIIRITEVWFDDNTGELLQYGSNYGDLVY